MATLDEYNIKLLTFDCYGTLIDWEAGIRSSLVAIADVKDPTLPDLVDDYIRTEASLEQREYRSYVEIQRRTLESLAEKYHLTIPQGQTDILTRDMALWPPFPDTIHNLKRLKSKFMLGILSNIDVDLFATTNKQLDMDFDLVITAEDVQSYKPSHAHFLRAIEQSAVEKDEILHVAQSVYHDAIPAAALGINFVWINRYGQPRPPNVRMIAEYPDLQSFADAYTT